MTVPTDQAPAELVHYAVADAVATITLDSPANRNALSRQLVTELFAHLERAGADPDVRAVLVESSGKVFCSGADLGEASSEGMEAGTRRIVDLQRLIATLDKPVVTKNLGAVRAGGIGIVAAADIAISAEDATFALTEVKLGLAAAIISLTVHHRMTPRAAALTTLGGEVFTGAEAAAYGLVTKAVPADRPRRRGRRRLRQPGDRGGPGPPRVQAHPQPRPRRAHRRARGGDGRDQHPAVRLRRGARGDDRLPLPQEVAPVCIHGRHPVGEGGGPTSKEAARGRHRRPPARPRHPPARRGGAPRLPADRVAGRLPRAGRGRRRGVAGGARAARASDRPARRRDLRPARPGPGWTAATAPQAAGTWLALVGGALSVLSTAAIAAPLHGRLATVPAGERPQLLGDLGRVDLIRTVGAVVCLLGAVLLLTGWSSGP